MQNSNISAQNFDYQTDQFPFEVNETDNSLEFVFPPYGLRKNTKNLFILSFLWTSVLIFMGIILINNYNSFLILLFIPFLVLDFIFISSAFYLKNSNTILLIDKKSFSITSRFFGLTFKKERKCKDIENVSVVKSSDDDFQPNMEIVVQCKNSKSYSFASHLTLEEKEFIVSKINDFLYPEKETFSNFGE